MQGSQVGAKVEMADSVLKVVEIDVDLNVIAQRERVFALWRQAFGIGRNDAATWGNDTDVGRDDFASWGTDADRGRSDSAMWGTDTAGCRNDSATRENDTAGCRNDFATRGNESAVGRNDFASQGNEPGTREIRSATARNEGYMKLNAFLIYTYSFFSRNGNMVLWYDTSDEICPKKLNILFYMLYI